MSSGLRRLLRNGVERTALWLSEPLDGPALVEPAVIFAPHPDDETLGCGGTIIRKVRAGADVRVVFLSDGSGSHRHLMAAEKLAGLRRREALAATGALGLDRRAVTFFDLPERTLAEREASLVERIGGVLAAVSPTQVFIPSRLDVHPDHQVTNRVVRKAVSRRAGGVTVFEYPIWLWNCWPWTPMSIHSRSQAPRALLTAANCVIRRLVQFRCKCDIGQVAGGKREALACHASQTRRLIDTPRWRVLADVAGGEWLACLLRDYEVFRRYVKGPAQTASNAKMPRQRQGRQGKAF